MTVIAGGTVTATAGEWATRTQRLRHALADDATFEDEALARLLDDVDPAMVGIKTMGQHCPDPAAWYRCTREGVLGREVLEAVRRGRLWVNLSAVHEADPRFARVLDAVYEGLEARVPGLRTRSRRLGLLLSSPGAHVVYHVDPLGQGLLQVRGRKRVWTYPPVAPYLPPAELEEVVRGVREEDLTYDPAYDDAAQVFELEPGDMLTFALNAPHRVVNADSMNVSLTIEHRTPHVLRSYAMNDGNGVLRSLGRVPRSRSLTGPSFWGKVALTAADRALARRRRPRPPAAAHFAVDAASPTGVRPLAHNG